MILLRLYLEFAKTGLFAVGGGLACGGMAPPSPCDRPCGCAQPLGRGGKGTSIHAGRSRSRVSRRVEANRPPRDGFDDAI